MVMWNKTHEKKKTLFSSTRLSHACCYYAGDRWFWKGGLHGCRFPSWWSHSWNWYCSVYCQDLGCQESGKTYWYPCPSTLEIIARFKYRPFVPTLNFICLYWLIGKRGEVRWTHWRNHIRIIFWKWLFPRGWYFDPRKQKDEYHWRPLLLTCFFLSSWNLCRLLRWMVLDCGTCAS